jgi:RNA polymerase sigma factor (TIGR02999 family)
MSEVIRILSDAAGGDPHAAELLPLVYDELRKLAAAQLAREAPGNTLGATALVHEAYLRLVGPDEDVHWDSRGHFFAAAATAMRRILIDRARHKQRAAHGGGRRQEMHPDLAAAPEDDDDLLALARLAEHDPVKARLVELRYFAGLTGEQAAQTLGISPKTADRYWSHARAWLRREMEGRGNGRESVTPTAPPRRIGLGAEPRRIRTGVSQMTEESLFADALSLPPEGRAEFLEKACAGRPQLRAAVEALLAAHEKSGNLLDRRPAGLGQAGDPRPDAAADDLAVTTGHELRPSQAGAGGAVAAGAVIGGRYVLVEKLGGGGMGEVWVASQTEPVKRKAALKLIRAGMDSKGVLARFEQERQALALMDHPSIAKVLDGGATPSGQPFFVMELVNGLP